MMQLLCDGVFLDLPSGADLQFKHDNPLFAFDKIACERTCEFSLPATPTNDKVFSLARVPAYSGEGMRRKFTAQLQAGAVVLDGYLYVGSWTGSEYKAVFVCGELIGLQTIRNAGKIADFFQTSGSIVWDVSNTKDANTTAGRASVAMTRYVTNETPVHPSIDIGDMMDAAYYSLTGKHISTWTRGFRYIPSEVKGLPEIDVQFTFAGSGVSPTPDANYPAASYANNLTCSLAGVIDTDSQQQIIFVGAGGNFYYWKLRQFVARQSIILTFPEDFPSDYFLMSVRDTGGADPEYVMRSDAWFLGGYLFRENATQAGTYTVGTPLAGRSVTVPTGTPFILMRQNWFEWVPNGGFHGFRLLSDVSYAYTFTIHAQGEGAVPGDTIRTLELLPDMTLTELMKMYSYCVGKILTYNESGGVTFDDLNYSLWPTLDISNKLIKRGEVQRTFSDYGQKNIIRFESGDDVPSNQRVTAIYTIDNDNLEEENELAAMQCSEGRVDAEDGYIVARFDTEEAGEHKLYQNGIMFSGACVYGLRISLPINAGVQALCTASTQLIARVRMSLYEYNQLTAKTLVLLEGTRYVWTAKSWQKNTAELTLAKLLQLETHGLTYDTIQTLVNDYSERVALAIITYASTHAELVAYINTDPHIASSLVNTDTRRYIHGGVSNQISTGIVPTITMTIRCLYRMNSYRQYHAVFQQGHVNEEAQTTAARTNNSATTMRFTHCGRTGGGGYVAAADVSPQVSGTWVQMELNDTQVVVNGVSTALSGTNRGSANNNPIWLLGRGSGTYGADDIDIANFETVDGSSVHKLIPYKENGRNYVLDIETLTKIEGTFEIREE